MFIRWLVGRTRFDPFHLELLVKRSAQSDPLTEDLSTIAVVAIPASPWPTSTLNASQGKGRLVLGLHMIRACERPEGLRAFIGFQVDRSR